MFSFLCGPIKSLIDGTPVFQEKQMTWVKNVLGIIDEIIIPITIILGVAGTVFITILSVRVTRAESPDKARIAKQKLLDVVVIILSILAFLWLFAYLMALLPPLFVKTK